MKKVLIVEDSKSIISLLKKELENYPKIEAVFSMSYEQTKILVENDKNFFHASLLDLHLPDAPNGEIVDLIVENDIPAVIFTNSENELLKQNLFKKNIIDYILKSDIFNIKYAIQAISRTLKNYDTTVLVVDDSKLFRSILTKALKNIHLNILEAKDGQEALEIVEKNKTISIVITDYEMPRLNGLQLTLKLREQYTKDNLAIIAISSAQEQEAISKFLKYGANDYINKPFSQNDITLRINSNLELLDLFKNIKDLANKDFLTGAYNRRFFFESGESIYKKSVRKNAPLAVAMIDIDKFKNINDTYGHDVGDVAIKEIKKILDANLRESDLMARFGGEEFCILLEDITAENTKNLFEKIRKAFETNIITIDKLEISYTISTGIYYGLSDSLEEMIKLSDEALYEAKETGRNKVVVIQE